jgi:hypothetical protein
MREHSGGKPAPGLTGNGLQDEHSGEPLDRSLITKPKRRQADRGNPIGANKKTDRVMATIVPDETWPGMWRVRMPDGHLTDMVNLTRAKGAAVALSRAVSCPGETRDDGAPDTTQVINTIVPASALRLVIEPTPNGRKWTARLNDRVICCSVWPFVKSARLLLAEGHPADTMVEVWRPNTAEWAMRGRLGPVAAMVIGGETSSRRAKNRSPTRDPEQGGRRSPPPDRARHRVASGGGQ